MKKLILFALIFPSFVGAMDTSMFTSFLATDPTGAQGFSKLCGLVNTIREGAGEGIPFNPVNVAQGMNPWKVAFSAAGWGLTAFATYRKGVEIKKAMDEVDEAKQKFEEDKQALQAEFELYKQEHASQMTALLEEKKQAESVLTKVLLEAEKADVHLKKTQESIEEVVKEEEKKSSFKHPLHDMFLPNSIKFQ